MLEYDFYKMLAPWEFDSGWNCNVYVILHVHLVHVFHTALFVKWTKPSEQCHIFKTTGNLLDRTGRRTLSSSTSKSEWVRINNGATPYLCCLGVCAFTLMLTRLTLMWHWPAVWLIPSATIRLLNGLNTWPQAIGDTVCGCMTIFQSELLSLQCFLSVLETFFFFPFL